MARAASCGCGCGQDAKPGRSFIHGHRTRLPRRQGSDYLVDPETGCWEWQHCKTLAGYGKVTVDGREVLAHRYLYEKKHGPTPDGWDLDHLCRNPVCVNPEHLEPVTHAENCRRGARAKLTWDDVFEIRDSSESYSRLALRFGVSTCAISNIRNHKRWREDEFTPARKAA